MTLKKVTTYVDEDLLRSVKVLAARTDSRVYEILDEALRKHLSLSGKEPGSGREGRSESLAEALSRTGASEYGKAPGMRGEEGGVVSLSEGETLSEAVVSERKSRRY